MLSFQNFNKRQTFATICEAAFSYGFSSEDTDTPYYSQISRIGGVFNSSQSTKITQSYLAVDMNEVLHKNTSKYLDSIEVDCVEDNDVYTQDLFSYISDNMEDDNVISLSVSLENYIYDEETSDFVTHSVLMVLHPSRKNSKNKKDYNLFCFNSHGGAQHYTNFHYKKLSSTRKKKIKFTKPIDFILANEFVRSFNRSLNKYSITGQSIHYSETDSHNYLGTNLQSYDNHGCCFIFPILLNLVLHTNYNKYFINECESSNTPCINSTACSLLEEGNPELFVYQALSLIDKRFNKHIVSYYKNKDFDMEDLEEAVDNHLDVYKNRFVKRILTRTIGFIKQPYWQLKSVLSLLK